VYDYVYSDNAIQLHWPNPSLLFQRYCSALIGVLLGFIITGMPMSIIMTGMGLVALAGIVVRNGILLVEFTDVQLAEGLASARSHDTSRQSTYYAGITYSRINHFGTDTVGHWV
jgi:hypothetical protein